MRGLREFFIIVDRAIRRRILHECAEKSGASFQLAGFSSQVGNLRHLKVKSPEISDYNFDPKRFRARSHNGDGLRMTIVCHEEFISRAAAGDRGYSSVMAESHCFKIGRAH